MIKGLVFANMEKVEVTIDINKITDHEMLNITAKVGKPVYIYSIEQIWVVKKLIWF